ncbi:hypothetical protein BDZ91DRAFT_728996 [Kalaharituber pfeilii]|nr:hypothetical protein BDZ91DRAFT_728996 [Kalaharituber pfeilii]
MYIFKTSTKKLLAMRRIEAVDPNIAAFIEGFLQPNEFQISWDGKTRGRGRMTDGTPQGSSLSPVLFLSHHNENAGDS